MEATPGPQAAGDESENVPVTSRMVEGANTLPSLPAHGQDSLDNSSEDEDVDSDDDETLEEDVDEMDDYYYYSFHDDDAGDPDHEGLRAGDRLGVSGDGGGSINNNDDLEYVAHQCLTWEEAEKMLADQVEAAAKQTQVSMDQDFIDLIDRASGLSASRERAGMGKLTFPFSLQLPFYEAKFLLRQHNWRLDDEALASLARRRRQLQQQPRSMSPAIDVSSSSAMNVEMFCVVCATAQQANRFDALPGCGHTFCSSCWDLYFENQIKQGVTTSISCMSSQCDSPVLESFVLRNLGASSAASPCSAGAAVNVAESLRQRYSVLAFQVNCSSLHSFAINMSFLLCRITSDLTLTCVSAPTSTSPARPSSRWRSRAPKSASAQTAKSPSGEY